MANHGGIIQYARLAALPQHFVQVALEDMQAVAAQHVCHQGRALLFAHRRQLCTVANQQQSAVVAIIYKGNQVVEQHATGKRRVVAALIGNH